MQKLKEKDGPGKWRTYLETEPCTEGVRVRVPVLIARGAETGPTGVIMAGQHGRELNGIAAIERVFETLEPDTMRGTAIFLPVMNPMAVRSHAQDYPTEKGRYRPVGVKQNMNLNRAWLHTDSGKPTYVAAIANMVWDEVMQHADFGIDLHGWTGLSLCLAWAHSDDREYLRAFGLPWIVVKEETGSAGLTEDLAAREGIPWITCELVPQNRIDQDSVAHGVRGIRNALRFHGILEEPVVAPSLQYEFSEDHTETVIRTPFEGLLVGECEKGDWVEAGQTVLRVLSLETLETSFTFEAPHDALVFNIGGTHWGEDIPESFVVFSGQEVGILKQPKHLH